MRKAGPARGRLFLWRAPRHSLAWLDGWGGKGGRVKIDYRPVHDFTLTDDIAYIKPKARVY